MRRPMLLHVDMDAFFAAIEQRVNPSLRGKPVIIGGRNNKRRSIICAASYEAKARGIKNAMPSWLALQICPEAVFVPADTEKYIHTSRGILAILQEFTPHVEQYSIDEFFLALDGCAVAAPLLEAGRAIKRRIREAFGITCTVAAAPTKTAAKLVAKMHKPDGLALADRGEVLRLMQDLPVEKLCGIGGRLQRRLNYLGIHTCGQLAAFPGGILRERFGVMGLWLQAVCRVEEVAAFEGGIGEPHGEDRPKSFGHSQTLREATDEPRFVRDWIHLLCEMAAARMRRARMQGRTVHLYISDGFGGGFSKQKTFTDPTYDGREIFRRCLVILRLLGLRRPAARVLAVSVSHLSPANPDYLFAHLNRRDRLLHRVDAINEKYGEWTVYPAALKGAVY